MRNRETAKVVAFTVAIFLVLFLRRPDALLNAQFWAEDGGVFFREQVLFGFRGCFLRPYSDYLHVIPRFVMALMCFLPVRFVPLGCNLAALSIESICCSAFFWPCYRRIIASDALRATCCLAVAASVIVGNELVATISNAQWYLCLLSLLLILTTARRLEIVLITAQVCIAFSAPITLLYTPFLLWQVKQNSGRLKLRPIIHLVALFSQAWIMRHGVTAPKPVFRFNSLFLATLESGISRCILSPLLGTNFLWTANEVSLFTKMLLALIACVVLLTLLCVKLYRTPQMRWLIGLIYIACGSLVAILWGRGVLIPFLTIDGLRHYTAERYFFVGTCMFIFFVVLTLDTFVPPRHATVSALLLAGIFAWGTIHNFGALPLLDLNWYQNAAKIEQWEQSRNRGEKVAPLIVPINPPKLVLVLD